ncbi:PAS domain S-box protein [Halobacteria archaeon AArc-dxtr1]|nr:PAS domain S-box protein [Halobacteria archaeon AArc-dxtr1]
MGARSGDEGEMFLRDDDDAALRQFRTLVKTIDDGIYQLDADGTIVAANDAIVEATGYARDELLGEDVSRIIDDDDHAAIEREVSSQLDGGNGELTTFELSLRTATGENVPCELRVTPLVDGDEFRGTIGVARERETPTQALETAEAPGTSYKSISTVLDEADIGVFVLDDNFDIAWADESVEHYFGVDRDAIIGRNKREVLDETIQHTFEDPTQVVETILATYEDNDYVERFECLVTAAGDRDKRWLEHYSKPIGSGQYAGGRIELYYDITDRKYSESDLQASREEFHSLVDAVEEYGIFRLDSDGYVASWNEGARQIKGYDREEIVGDHFSRFYTEEDRDADVPERNLEAATEHGSVEDEGWRLRQDGTRFWANVTITPIRGSEGEHRGYLKVTRDITAQRKREQGLENELEHIFGRIDDAFYGVDEEFRFTHVNERAEELLQHDAADLLGEQLWDVFPDLVEIDEVWDAFHTALETQQPTSYELYYDTLDFWVEANLYPSETGISVYFRDVTDRKEREQALKESEQRYRTLAEYFPNGLVTLFDHDLEYTLAAGQGFDRIPVEPDDLEGKPFRDAWDESTADTLEPAFRAALDGTEMSVELAYADRDWILHVVPITDERGEVFAGMTMAQDVTEQKERERYLEDAKSQLEAATEAGAVGTWEWHVQEDEFITGSSFAKTFGIDPDDARDGIPLERVLSSVHEADRDRVVAEIEAALESCGEYETEYRVQNADGEWRWVVARGHVECEEDGTPRTFPGALTDITRRKRAEIRAEKQTRQLETLFQVLPVGIVVADADGSIRRTNDTAREIWGGEVFDVESVSEDEQYEAVWADSGEPVAPGEWTMAQVLRGEAVTDPNIYEIEAFDGESRVIMEHGMPVRDEHGEVSRAVVTLTDITERREYQRRLEETIEQLETSNERLEHFAYAASHDLQEPLRMVSSYLQLLEGRYEDALDDEGAEFLDFAVDGAERMRAMVDGLLEYSRVETRGDPVEPVELDTVLEEVREDLQLQIEESDAEITVEQLPRVEGDASQLRQLLQNLLSNAIEYSGDEPPQITVSADRNGSRQTVSVHDEGIGIDPEYHDQIFEVFKRLHSRKDHAGTGIGLALCQRIVERHGGDIWVDSAANEGTTISFTLPAVE